MHSGGIFTLKVLVFQYIKNVLPIFFKTQLFIFSRSHHDSIASIQDESLFVMTYSDLSGANV